MNADKKKPNISRWRRWTLAMAATVGMTGAALTLTAPDVFAPPEAPPPDAAQQIHQGKALRTEPLAKVFEASALDRRTGLLMASAERNSIDQLLEAVGQGADIRTRNDLALRVATASGAPDVARVLLDLGADSRANNGEPLANAVVNNDMRMVDLLLLWGADVRDNDNAALWWAVEGGHRDLQKLLVERGAQVSNDMLTLAQKNNDADSFMFLAQVKMQQGAQSPDPASPSPRP